MYNSKFHKPQFNHYSSKQNNCSLVNFLWIENLLKAAHAILSVIYGMTARMMLQKRIPLSYVV